MKYLLILATLALTACGPGQTRAEYQLELATQTKADVTRWTQYIERPRTDYEVMAGKACLKIRCTEPAPHRPAVQP